MASYEKARSFRRILILLLYDTKNRGYKSFGVRSPTSWIWNTYSNIITYGVVRDCFKMHELRKLQSQTD